MSYVPKLMHVSMKSRYRLKFIEAQGAITTAIVWDVKNIFITLLALQHNLKSSEPSSGDPFYRGKARGSNWVTPYLVGARYLCTTQPVSGGIINSNPLIMCKPHYSNVRHVIEARH
jgi:hypothetical protein